MNKYPNARSFTFIYLLLYICHSLRSHVQRVHCPYLEVFGSGTCTCVIPSNFTLVRGERGLCGLI